MYKKMIISALLTGAFIQPSVAAMELVSGDEAVCAATLEYLRQADHGLPCNAKQPDNEKLELVQWAPAKIEDAMLVKARWEVDRARSVEAAIAKLEQLKALDLNNFIASTAVADINNNGEVENLIRVKDTARCEAVKRVNASTKMVDKNNQLLAEFKNIKSKPDSVLGELVIWDGVTYSLTGGYEAEEGNIGYRINSLADRSEIAPAGGVFLEKVTCEFLKK